MCILSFIMDSFFFSILMALLDSLLRYMMALDLIFLERRAVLL